MPHTEIPDRGRGQTSSPKKTSSSRPGYGGSSTNKKGVNTSTYTSKNSNTSKSSKDISKEIDKAMSDRQDQRNQQNQGIMAKIGLGDIEKGYIGDDAFNKTVPAGQHKLRTQYDLLLAKYGPGFADTEQAKVLANYLSGVQQEKGGGLGARDTDYGGGEISEYDQAGNFITKAKRAEAEKYRQQQLGIMGLNNLNPNQPFQSQGFNKDNFNFELARRGLSPEQYQNYIRQMIAADPREGNTLGKENFGSPFADFMAKAMQFAPGIGVLSRVLPKGDPTESQVYGQGNKTFYDTSMPEQGGGGGIMNINNEQYIPPEVNIPLPETSEATPIADLTPTPTGVASLTPTSLDYASIAPQFSSAMGPQYVNQGINDPRFAQYYQNLSDYYGYNT